MAQETDKPSLKDAIRSRQSGAEQAPAQTAAPRTTLWQKQIVVSGPGLKHTTMFCRQLSTLLNVGMSLQRSLQILSVRTQHPQLRETVKEVYRGIEAGSTFSDALAKHPKIFSPMFVNVVKIGEVGGILESSLARLTEILESKVALRRKVISASLYPLVVLIVVALVISIILLHAVPRFKEAMADVDPAQMPGITRFVFGLSDVMTYTWPIVYGGFFALLAVGWLLLRTAAGKRAGEALLIAVPKLRNLPVNIALARATRSLGSLMTAGIPLLESIKVTANSSESYRMRDALIRVHDSLESGGNFEAPLRNEETIFPPLITDMIAVGEEAGALDTMLLNIADNCENDVEATLSSLQSILEPLLILIMGFVVLFVASAMFLPYFQIARSVGEQY